MTFSVLNSLNNAKRPVLIAGAGVRLANACEEIRQFSRLLGIPVAPTWAALDIFPSDDPLTIGSFGTHGTRYGNFAVQNADWILAVGSRLDSKATGTPVDSFAREAKVIMVDIDQAEIDKFSSRVTGICQDAKQFLTGQLALSHPGFPAWLKRIEEWKTRYPICPPSYEQEQGVNPYVLIRDLSRQAREGEIVCTDTGCAVAWVSQAWKWKSGQRFIHAFNQTPMGYGLPAAIGAHYATGKPVLLVTGDGSLMMSIGELATVAGNNLPIKIVMLDNKGHAMCRQTQREWMGATYPSTSIEGGLRFPDFRALAKAFKVDMTVYDIHPDHDVIPKTRFGRPNEDGHPLLPRDEFRAQMIIKPR